MTCQTHKY